MKRTACEAELNRGEEPELKSKLILSDPNVKDVICRAKGPRAKALVVGREDLKCDGLPMAISMRRGPLLVERFTYAFAMCVPKWHMPPRVLIWFYENDEQAKHPEKSPLRIEVPLEWEGERLMRRQEVVHQTGMRDCKNIILGDLDGGISWSNLQVQIDATGQVVDIYSFALAIGISQHTLVSSIL